MIELKLITYTTCHVYDTYVITLKSDIPRCSFLYLYYDILVEAINLAY